MLYLCLILMLFPFHGLSQEKQMQTRVRTAVYGVVSDYMGTPVSGVTVTAGALETTTFDDGKFFLQGLEAGQAVIEFTKPGFETVRRSINVNVGQTIRINISAFKRLKPRESQKNLLGFPLEQITKRGVNLFASPSPDGQKLAVEVLDEDTYGFDVWIIDSSGARIAKLSQLSDNESNPRWSPVGGAILFSSSSFRNGYRIWSIPDTGNRSADFLDYGITPAWSPDAEWIVYSKSF